MNHTRGIILICAVAMVTDILNILEIYLHLEFRTNTAVTIEEHTKRFAYVNYFGVGIMICSLYVCDISRVRETCLHSSISKEPVKLV
jgi:hypothetical protein